MPRAKPLHFGQVVAELRLARGLSVYALAALAGVNKQAIHNIEAGTMPRLDTARRLAAALGVGLDAIADRLPEPAKKLAKKSSTPID